VWQAGKVRLETIQPHELGTETLEKWRAHQRARPELASPYLTPEWALLVGEARGDARICIINDGEGFFGAQRMSAFSAMGMGAPIADYQGIVSSEPLDVSSVDLCRALNTGRIDLTHVPAGAAPIVVAGHEGSWIAETSGARELYEAALKQRRSEFVRQTEKKARKLARDKSEPVYRVHTAPSAQFETLLAWKNAQLERSNQPRIWATKWVRDVLERCAETQTHEFAGLTFTLEVDGQLVAGAFCLKSARVLHFWIVAHDNAFDAYSPGVQLARWIVGWAAEHGIAEVDFGPGDYQYKRQLSTTQRMLSYGVASGQSLSGLMRRTTYAMRSGVERVPHARIAAFPGKAMRRLDLMRALG